MSKQSKYPYSIENLDLGINWQDCGPWRNFELTAYGETQEEFLNSITISAIDQDGGVLYTLELENPKTLEIYKGGLLGGPDFIDNQMLAAALRAITDYLDS